MITERLKQAIQLVKSGKRGPARDLILEEVKLNPGNLDAWLWALEVAANEKEQRLVLGKILAIDPSHQGAINYLRKLDQGKTSEKSSFQEDRKSDAVVPESPAARKGSLVSGILGLVVDWASSLPSGCIYIAIFIGIITGILIYTRMNTSLFGLAGTDFDDLVISNSYELISSDELYWEVQFEGIGDSKYIGIVRHVSPIRIQEFAILTHDILVTTGDFANPDIVNINVVDHKFIWRSLSGSSPTGSINLIHAVPANKSIYQQLLDIHKWDTVKITGREILSVQAFQSDQSPLDTWLDIGCNTLLIESVTIVKGTE